MVKDTIEELRELKKKMSICFESEKESRIKDISTLNKAIIACEQLQKARKKAKRWKRKCLEMRSIVDKSVEVLDFSDKNGLHLSYPAWCIAHRLSKALEPYLLKRLKGEQDD